MKASRPETTGSFNKINHLACRTYRQRMMGEIWPWRNVGCHLAGKVNLPIRCLSEQRDHQILKRDNANAELHQIGICQFGDLGFHFVGN
jgi:hypothetical protein